MNGDTFQQFVHRVRQSKNVEDIKLDAEAAYYWSFIAEMYLVDLREQLNIKMGAPERARNEYIANLFCSVLALIAEMATCEKLSLSQLMHRSCHTKMAWEYEYPEDK